MDYKTALRKLEELLSCLDKTDDNAEVHSSIDRDRPRILYGEVEEIIQQIVGVHPVEVPLFGNTVVSYPNLIEAGYFSGRTFHKYAGRNELLKVIGRVRQLAENPQVIQINPSANNVIQILRRFRECCQYIVAPPTNEKEVQEILWIMLRAQCELLQREETLKTFGVKAYRPDFGLPDLRLLIEAKFIGQKTNPASIQGEIFADIPGYLNETSQYDAIIVFIYDFAHKLRNPTPLISDLKKVDGIFEVIVMPGIGAETQL